MWLQRRQIPDPSGNSANPIELIASSESLPVLCDTTHNRRLRFSNKDCQLHTCYANYMRPRRACQVVFYTFLGPPPLCRACRCDGGSYGCPPMMSINHVAMQANLVTPRLSKGGVYPLCVDRANIYMGIDKTGAMG